MHMQRNLNFSCHRDINWCKLIREQFDNIYHNISSSGVQNLSPLKGREGIKHTQFYLQVLISIQGRNNSNLKTFQTKEKSQHSPN